jgi:hypothetical protein
VRASEEVASALSAEQVAAAFDVSAYLTHVDETYRRLGLPLSQAASAVDAERPQVAVEAGIGGGTL